MTSKKKKSVLVYGTWPDPRASGISSVEHDVIQQVNVSGREVYLITPNWDNINSNPLGISLMRVPKDRPFDWREVTAHREQFANLEELVEKDRKGELNRGSTIFGDVGIIHSHSDDMVPHYNANERNTNNYGTIQNHVERLSAFRPKLVRTRYDEIHAAIDRLNRLTGLDWESLSPDQKEFYLEDGRRIQPVVETNISAHREELKERYKVTDEYLDQAVGHVWYVLHQIKLWKQETKDADTIVALTRNGLEKTINHTLSDGERRKFTAIYNGTSFRVQDRAKIEGRLYDYHVNDGLTAYRGSSEQKESIHFNPEDKKVVFVGRPAVDKGIFELVESIARLYHNGNHNVRGIFVGDFDQETRKKLEAIDPENAKNYLLFTGRVNDSDEVASIISFGNVTVLPSHYGTYNLVAAESLLLGKPLVVTDFSGIGDAYVRTPFERGVQVALPVKKSETSGPGRYFGVDTDSLTEQIGRIINDDELAFQLSENGRRYAEEHLTGERMGREYAGLFDQLLLEEENSARNQKIHVAFFCTTTENTHGVPVVMNNIAEQLRLNPKYEVSFITNHFDNNQITFVDSQGKEHTFNDRTEFVAFAERERIEIDILHTHTWHISDYFKPLHTGRDQIDLPALMRGIGSPKIVYTDHANPTEDLRKIEEQHPGTGYDHLDNEQKAAFLQANLLDQHPVDRWQKGWDTTSILSKRQLMNLADVVTFVSATQMHEEEGMIPHYRFQDKARVVMNGVDIGRYNVPRTHELAQEIRRELGISADEKVILYAGRMDQEKGVYDLAQAAEILNVRGEDVTVVYLGSNGYNNYVQERLRQTSPHVRSILAEKIGRDQRERMAAMYALADIVAQPTWGECFNQVAAEALAMGTPVVTSNYSATGEIYVQSGAALGCEVRDPEDLANKLSEGLHNTNSREKITKIGQELVQSTLNVEAMARNYMDIYQSLTR